MKLYEPNPLSREAAIFGLICLCYFIGIFTELMPNWLVVVSGLAVGACVPAFTAWMRS